MPPPTHVLLPASTLLDHARPSRWNIRSVQEEYCSKSAPELERRWDELRDPAAHRPSIACPKRRAEGDRVQTEPTQRFSYPLPKRLHAACTRIP